jgi:hypothetical protein
VFRLASGRACLRNQPSGVKSRRRYRRHCWCCADEYKSEWGTGRLPPSPPAEKAGRPAPAMGSGTAAGLSEPEAIVQPNGAGQFLRPVIDELLSPVIREALRFRSPLSACSAILSSCLRSASKLALVAESFAAVALSAHLRACCRRCSERVLLRTACNELVRRMRVLPLIRLLQYSQPGGNMLSKPILQNRSASWNE